MIAGSLQISMLACLAIARRLQQTAGTTGHETPQTFGLAQTHTVFRDVVALVQLVAAVIQVMYWHSWYAACALSVAALHICTPAPLQSSFIEAP